MGRADGVVGHAFAGRKQLRRPRVASLFDNAKTLRWRGATPAFAAWADRMKAPQLLERCEKAGGPMTMRC
jgi:hypothetical protein